MYPPDSDRRPPYAASGSVPRGFALPLPTLRDRRFGFDFVLASLIATLSAVTVSSIVDQTGGLGLVPVAGLISAVMLRRTVPRVALIISIAASLMTVVVFDQATFAIVTIPIMVYTSARWASESQAKVALGFGLLGSLLGPIRWIGQSLDFDRLPYLVIFVVACAGSVIGPYLLGSRRSEAIAARRQQEAAESERLRLVQAEQSQRAQSAAMSERQRIARELHDIVAHSLSVIVVQAEGGRAITTKHPERAPEVLATIAEASREALEEMRTMVGLLRNESDDNASRRPAPGLGDIAELVRRTSDQVTLEVHGAIPTAPPALGLTAYRTVQESLTNMLKHAGPHARGAVRVDYLPDTIRLSITDDGRGAAATSDGQGHGLQGMAERVALHGGTLSAGPARGGGFAVYAQLPLRPLSPAPSHPQRRSRP